MLKQLELKNTSYFARSKQQNFHEAEVISGYVIKLIKQTQENIRLGKQTIKEKGNNVYRQSRNYGYWKQIQS